MANPASIHLVDHEDDEHGNQKGYIKGTDYSLPYTSQWARLNQLDEGQKMLLRNLNCSWLSTHGSPPTLLALKQHAQSLCILIHALCPTVRSAEINYSDEAGPLGLDLRAPAIDDETRSSGIRTRLTSTPAPPADPLTIKYRLNDAFDFLADLSNPYENDDPNHLKPLNFLVNDVRKRDEVDGTEYHCPFAESTARAKGEKAKPYATHHNLLIHANACLERLDHEFSSTGGLISILPTGEEHDTQQLRDARNSLLGSWILYTQHLVARMHELERSYANALDALAGEATIPRQYISNMGTGPDGRSVGREIAFPQDRWILANAGDDVFKFVNQLLDKQEATSQIKDKVYRNNGAASSYNLVTQHDGGEYMRGIAFVDVKTRYYRLMGQGHTTIFVLPAWEHHPGVEYTRKIENEPTIVASVQPKWPARATDFEQKYNERLKRASKLEHENIAISRRAQHLEAQVHTLEVDGERERTMGAFLAGLVGKEQVNNIEDAVKTKITTLTAEKEELEKQIALYLEEKDKLVAYRAAVETANEDLRAEKRVLAQRLASLGASTDTGVQPAMAKRATSARSKRQPAKAPGSKRYASAVAESSMDLGSDLEAEGPDSDG